MTKIEALQKTIYNLENDVYEYDWSDMNNCNCGVLAKTILGGRNPIECGLLDSPKCTWMGASGQFLCLTTDLPLPLVFQSVKDAGFTYDEMYDLETLENNKIRKKAGMPTKIDDDFCSYQNKSTVIKYFKGWVEILQDGESVKPKPDGDTIEYPDLTQSLAVLPIEETSDVVKVKEVVK